MEVATLKHRSALRGPTPLLRLQGDERLVALTRRGNQSAYEVLVARYQARLLAFCRHMLASREDAEDVLQEVFAAAFNAMMADERPINVRPWLYRIARNRSLNHLRKQTAIGVDSMDVHFADHGTSTADKVHDREAFRQLVGDVQELPETQRTALLLREIDALSYEQIAQAMETTVPAIKSLLVRARVGLAESAEARALSCDEVRDELGEVAEGLRRKSPPVRRHVRACERCAGFDKQLSTTNRALAALFPVGPLLLAKKFLLAQGASSAAGAASAAGGAAAAGAGSGAAGSALTAGMATFATKTAAVVAGAAIISAGAVEVDHSRRPSRATRALAATVAPTAAADALAPRVVATTPQPVLVSDVALAPTARRAAPTVRVKHAAVTRPRHAAAAPKRRVRVATRAATSTAGPGIAVATTVTDLSVSGTTDTQSGVSAALAPAMTPPAAASPPAGAAAPAPSSPAASAPAPSSPAAPAPAEPAPAAPAPAPPEPAAAPAAPAPAPDAAAPVTVSPAPTTPATPPASGTTGP